MGIFAVVLTPTRELAVQIYEQFQAISGHYHVKSVLIIGGNGKYFSLLGATSCNIRLLTPDPFVFF